MNRLIRFPLVTLLVLVVAFTTFAFASSQTGGAAGGEGADLVSGYNISGVHYLLSEDASKLAAVEFDLNAPANVVKASVNSSTGVFFDCQNAGGYHWVCSIHSSVNVSDANELKVIATGK